MTRFQCTRLIRLEWQLRSREDGRLLQCGIFETDEGQALMAGHDAGWLWYLPLENGWSAVSVSRTAGRWREAVLATGAYEDIVQDVHV